MRDYKTSYKILKVSLEEKGINVSKIERKLKALKIETPSWGYSDSGTRFAIFKQKGAAKREYKRKNLGRSRST